jgi:IS605 OrfB family transposase
MKDCKKFRRKKDINRTKQRKNENNKFTLFNNKKYIKLQNSITSYKNKIWLPKSNDDYKKSSLKSNSWFDIIQYTNCTGFCDPDIVKIPKPKNKKKDNNPIKCIKVDMHLTADQKYLMQNWFTAYIKMYNETIRFIKTFGAKEHTLNYKVVRTYFLKDIRNIIIKGSQFSDYERGIREASIKDINNEFQKLQNTYKHKLNTYRQIKVLLKWVVNLKKMLEILVNDTTSDSFHKLEELIETIKEDQEYPLDQIAMVLDKSIEIYKKSNSESIATVESIIEDIKATLSELRKSLVIEEDDENDDLENNEDTTNESQCKSTQIDCHILDNAIKLACANYKSAITNYKRGNIRKFRIRYWRYNRQYKILDIETQLIKNNTICKRVFGDIKCSYDKEEFKLNDIKKACKIYYDTETDKYTLLVPIEITNGNIKNAKELISIDQGMRTFITGLSEDEVIKLGTNVINRISFYLRIIDRRKNDPNVPNKKKKKAEKIYNRKISYLIDELHWKAIRFLTSTYKTILIGDLSVKGIVNKGKSKLSSEMKVIASRMKFYTFRKRLEYKCKSMGIKYREICEAYTTKTCSNCGSYNKNMTNETIYECKKCEITMDRDVNPCRSIYMLSSNDS